MINIIIWQKDNIKTKEIITEINKGIIPSKNKKIIDINYYIKMNKDTIGFIIVNNTNISYPFVQTNNNSYYLNHSFDKSYSNSGWLFMDYRNNYLNNKNTIIYAHARIDGTMFGTLKNTIKKNWYKNKSNHLITIITKNNTYYYQIFSSYIINNENYYITTDFKDDKEYINFLNIINKRSIYNYNVKLNSQDKILTLSSCYNNNKKIVVHAKRLN
jgi:sortase B